MLLMEEVERIVCEEYGLMKIVVIFGIIYSLLMLDYV